MLITPATFAKALASAKGGDVLELSAGTYPSVSIYNRDFGRLPLTLISDPATPAILPGLVFVRSSGLIVDGVTVDFQPDMKSIDTSAGVQVKDSTNVALRNMQIIGRDAVAGVPASAPKLDATNAVIGFPVGRGIVLQTVRDASIVNSKIFGYHRGVLLGAVNNVLVDGNEIHNVRTTALVGGGSNITVSNNLVSGARPWRQGQTPVGDHVDGMAFFSAPGQTVPNDNVKVIGNRILQEAGPGMMGIWFQGGKDGKSDFTNLIVRGNVIAVADLQGIALWNVNTGVISDNYLIPVFTAGVDVSKQRATVLLLEAVHNVIVARNRVGAKPADKMATAGNPTGNVFTDNPILLGALSLPSI